MSDTGELLLLPICKHCGTQFGPEHDPKTHAFGCRICADPRQYILPSGISYTSLKNLLDGETSPRNHNEILSLPGTSNIYTITTVPKFAIGQRAFFIKTPKGNILWDCVTLMDEPTQHFINANGGLKAIVISHPHFYSTHMYWARTFNCKVHTAREDAEWLHFNASRPEYWFLDKPTEVIVPGITAIKVGGHFPGSLVLHFDGGDGKRLFIADSMFTVPSGSGPFEYPPEGIVTYSFMWSIPNMIPLTPKAIKKICDAIEPFDFQATHGGFAGMDIVGNNVKGRVIESAQIAVKAIGYDTDVLA